MKTFKVTTAANTTYTVSPLKDLPDAYEIHKGEEHCLFFMGSKGQWSTGDFAPPFVDFDIVEIGKLVEFQLKSDD